MAFTTDLETVYGRIRLEIGDDVAAPNGILPRGENFTDSQLEVFCLLEGGDPDADPPLVIDIGRAAARACESLGRRWAAVPSQRRMGPVGQTLKASEYFAKEAVRLRRQYGYGQSTRQKARSMTAVNAYTLPPGIT